VQVAKGVVNKKTRSQILISSLMGESLGKNFKVVSEKKGTDGVAVTVEPKGDDLTIKSIDLVVDEKASVLKTVAYKDEVGNLTTMKFSDVKFLNKENKNLFKYQPPKDAQVTNL
jgi:outer membrane lipoprotein carrier protein